MIEITKSHTTLIEMIKSAQQFLWVVAYQLNDDNIIDLLVSQQDQGVDVRIVTLPVDSFSDPSQREHLSSRHRQLRNVFYCAWEIGDPTLTSSSRSGRQRGGGGDKWYSLHGKFLVSEKSALVLSANLDSKSEWEAFCELKSRDAIELFRSKFEQLVELFCASSTTDLNIKGHIYDLLAPELQRQLASEHRFLVPYYEPDLITGNAKLAEGLYICPFDAVARDLLAGVINEAHDFLGIAGETITDQDVVMRVLARKHYIHSLAARLIAGKELPRDANKRGAMRDNALQLESYGVDFRLVDDWHAKVWVTDSVVVVGSANLNPMGLGMRGRGHTLKANTEILFVSHDKREVEQAQQAFNDAFQQGTPAIEICYSKAEETTKELLTALNVSATPAARAVLGHISTSLRRKGVADFASILELARAVQTKAKAGKLDLLHVWAGVILWRLRKSATTPELLREAVTEAAGESDDFDAALQLLKDGMRIIKMENGVLAIDPIKLLR